MVMSAHPNLAAYFFEMEKLVEAQPDSVVAEIARGVYAMSPSSVRSKMIAGPAFGASDHISAKPFESLRLPLDSLFPGG
jgi:hypothetical protein